MGEIDFDYLRSLQRKERNLASLAEPREDLYEQIARYINELAKEASEARDPGKIRLLENSVKVARDALQMRIQKIVTRALRTSRTGEYSEKNLTKEELEMYKKLVQDLKEANSLIESILAGDYPSLEEKSRDEKNWELAREEELEKVGKEEGKIELEKGLETEKVINEEEKNIVLARVISSIPRFVAPDGREYGPYEPDDIIKLPREVAGVLGEQGLVEIL